MDKLHLYSPSRSISTAPVHLLFYIGCLEHSSSKSLALCFAVAVTPTATWQIDLPQLYVELTYWIRHENVALLVPRQERAGTPPLPPKEPNILFLVHTFGSSLGKKLMPWLMSAVKVACRSPHGSTSPYHFQQARCLEGACKGTARYLTRQSLKSLVSN